MSDHTPSLQTIVDVHDGKTTVIVRAAVDHSAGHVFPVLFFAMPSCEMSSMWLERESPNPRLASSHSSDMSILNRR